MHRYVPPDAEGGVSKVQYAVVYAPRSKRHRFSANCVEICANQEEALNLADSEKNLLAGRVLGPSKSSEGQFIYYLIEWLSS